jgi:predicted NAD/FAD-binding protein
VVAWLLHGDHDITLFESAPEVGGHTHTVDVAWDGERHAVDTGFIVYNDWTYPNFIRLLRLLGVATQESEMSFSVRCERTGLEYNGHSLNTLFAQRRNLLRPRFYRMLLDILRFNREALRLLERDEDPSLGEYLARGGYSRELVEHYVVPMGAAIWSSPARRLGDFPARFFVEFCRNHGLLSVEDRPIWRVVRGGSREYVRALTRPFADRIRRGTPVTRVARFADRVEVTPAGRSAETFDRVVLAAHSDQALAMLADPSPDERETLGAIRYQANDVVLHTDARLLPQRRRAWASWNYHVPAGDDGPVQVSYLMNRLQRLPTATPFVVSLNASHRIDPARVLGRFTYHHPVYTSDALRAQQRHDALDGRNRTHYCGAYWGYGFHEDGVVSGLKVARRLGKELPA